MGFGILTKEDVQVAGGCLGFGFLAFVVLGGLGLHYIRTKQVDSGNDALRQGLESIEGKKCFLPTSEDLLSARFLDLYAQVLNEQVAIESNHKLLPIPNNLFSGEYRDYRLAQKKLISGILEYKCEKKPNNIDVQDVVFKLPPKEVKLEIDLDSDSAKVRNFVAFLLDLQDAGIETTGCQISLSTDYSFNGEIRDTNLHVDITRLSDGGVFSLTDADLDGKPDSLDLQTDRGVIGEYSRILDLFSQDGKVNLSSCI